MQREACLHTYKEGTRDIQQKWHLLRTLAAGATETEILTRDTSYSSTQSIQDDFK